MISTEVSEKHHTLWLHSDSLVSKPTHFISAPLSSNQTSEYAEVAPAVPPHAPNTNPTPPEPYATVTLKRGVTTNLDDNCTNCASSSNSSEYNIVLRGGEQVNNNKKCDIPPPSPPLNMFNNYKPPNNMTIRTNPAALSPQIHKKVSHPTPGWSTLPPPIPNFPQNWIQQKQHQQNNFDSNQEIYSETDYESGSVLYEPCCQTFENSYFNVGGDPTEEYYRNVNMEFYNDQGYEPSTPPPPCPDPAYNNRNNIINDFRSTTGNKQLNSMYKNRRNNYSTIDGSNDKYLTNLNMNMRMNLSSDESDSDNSKWAPRYKTNRSRSKNSDKKFYNENVQVR